jgi:hypothetical protein
MVVGSRVHIGHICAVFVDGRVGAAVGLFGAGTWESAFSVGRWTVGAVRESGVGTGGMADRTTPVGWFPEVGRGRVKAPARGDPGQAGGTR